MLYDARRMDAPLMLKRKVEYFGFILERESEPVKKFPPEMAEQARQALAEAVARSEAQHMAVKQNRAAIEEVRELYRRSAGQTPRLGFAELTALYKQQLDEQGVNSLLAFRNARLVVRVDDFVPAALRQRLWRLPSSVPVRDREVELAYEVEEQPMPIAQARDATPQPAVPATSLVGVARLHLPEKLARTLTEEELPTLDRPLRFMVSRGQRGAVRADTLEELQELLEGPWSPNAPEDNEVSDEHEERVEVTRPDKHRQRKSQLKRPSQGTRRGGRGGSGRSGGRGRTGRRR